MLLQLLISKQFIFSTTKAVFERRQICFYILKLPLILALRYSSSVNVKRCIFISTTYDYC